MNILAWPAKNDLNPYVELTYCRFTPPRAKVINFRFSTLFYSADIFHIHWPEAIFWGSGSLPLIALLRALKVLYAVQIVRLGGGVVVLTLHNLSPHQGLTRWQTIIWKVYKRILLSRIDLVVSLSQDALAMYRSVYPFLNKLQEVVVPHPHYRTHYKYKSSLQESRERLGLPADKKIVGIVGSMRPSKMIPETISAFLRVSTEDEILFVTGCCDDAHWSTIQLAAMGHDRIRVDRGMLSEEMLGCAVTSCNVILLNQPHMLNSGTALLALSFDKPLISVAAGSMTELARIVGTDWLKLFVNPLNDKKLRFALDSTWKSSVLGSPHIESLDPKILSDCLFNIFKMHLAKKREDYNFT